MYFVQCFLLTNSPVEDGQGAIRESHQDSTFDMPVNKGTDVRRGEGSPQIKNIESAQNLPVDSHDAEHGVLQLDGVKALLPLGHRRVDVHAETHRRHTYTLMRGPYRRVDLPRKGSNSPAVLSPQPHGWQNAAHLLSLFSHQVLPFCARAIALPAHHKQQGASWLRVQHQQLGERLTQRRQTSP